MVRPLRAPYPFVPVEGAFLSRSLARTWERMMADIEGAREEVLLENYILVDSASTDRLTEALRRAKAQGAEIRLHIDAAGSYLLGREQERTLRELATLKIHHPPSLRTIMGGIRKRVMRRTHRRLLVIDRKVAWTGGMGFADQWWPENPERHREVDLRMEGAIVDHCRDAFLTLWQGDRRRGDLPVQQEPVDGHWRLVPQYAFGRRLFRLGLRRSIMHARERVWLRTAYFVPPRRLRREMRRAAERGVDVRLLLPGPRYHDHPGVRYAGHRYYAGLLRRGVRIFEYQPSFQHGKTALFDGGRALLGTPNIDRLSFRFNHEVAVQVQDRRLAAEVEAHFRDDFALSEEVTWEQWQKRPWFDRLREAFLSIFAPLM